MKIKYIKSIFFIIWIAFIITSCTETLSELNENPNSYQRVNPDFLFTNAMTEAVYPAEIACGTGYPVETDGDRYGRTDAQGREFAHSDLKIGR